MENIPFKKLSLLFDHIYVNSRELRLSQMDIELSSKISIEEKRFILSEIDWLIEKGMLKTYSIPRQELQMEQFDTLLAEDIQEVNKTIEANITPAPGYDKTKHTPGELQFVGVLGATNELIFKIEDIRLRIASVLLGSKDPLTEYVPLVNSFNSYGRKSSKDLAAHFVLNKIPIPAEDTSWTQLLEFRSDEEVKRKYYALMNWINEMAGTDMPLSHLADKYNQLYSEYLHQYRLHKLTSELTNVEVLLLGGLDFISSLLHQNIVTAFRGLLHIRKRQVLLLQEEKNLMGRELAYILAAKEKLT